jgi:hypothetical protein
MIRGMAKERANPGFDFIVRESFRKQVQCDNERCIAVPIRQVHAQRGRDRRSKSIRIHRLDACDDILSNSVTSKAIGSQSSHLRKDILDLLAYRVTGGH